MKNFKKISILSFGLIAPAIISCCSWSIKSDTQKTNQEVILFAQNNYVEVGESLQISVSSPKMEPTLFNWSVDSSTKDIYVTQTGILMVSDQLQIDDNIYVTVKAINKNDETQFGSIKITVVPKNQDSNFFGFEGGVIHSYNTNKQPISINVIRDKSNKKIFRLEKPLDLIQLQDPNPTAWVTFTPIIKHDKSKMMKWNYVKPETTPLKSLTWFDYVDDEETDVCPKFDITASILLKDQFVITFLCDGEDKAKAPKLIVDFNIWMNKDVPPMFSYFPAKKDAHVLEIAENEGKYNMQCFCPSNPGKLVYSNTIEGLYCFRNLHEYSNFKFEFKLSDSLPDKIKKSFSYKVSAIRYQRQLDNFPIYKINFWYSFNMADMLSSKECEYQELELGQLQAINDKPTPWAEGWIDFHIQWIK